MSRWDDDVVFKNQARGTEDKRKKEFVNVGEMHDLRRWQRLRLMGMTGPSTLGLP